MQYLNYIDLPSTILTREEEQYLDKLLSHIAWCKKNKGTNGRNIHRIEAISIFKDDIYNIALDLAINQDDGSLLEDIKNKSKLEFNQKIARAKQIPIVSLITTPIQQNKTICPFHEDSNASLHVYEETNSYWCYTCNVGGDTIDYIQRLNKCDFIQAINYLI